MLPSNVSFGTVVGRFMRAVADGPDAGRDPDGIPFAGLTVKFIPTADRFKNVTATPPVTIVADPITATTDAEGYLIDPQGERGVRLLATDDEDLSPTGWTWGVAISGTGFRTLTFNFALPTDGEIDLATVVPVPGNPGQAMQDWLAAVAATEAAATLAGESAVAAEAAAVDAVAAKEAAEAVPAQVDTAMAPILADPESTSGAVLRDTFVGSAGQGAFGAASALIRNAAPRNILLVGTSVAEGVGSSNRSRRWPLQMISKVRQMIGGRTVLGGEGYIAGRSNAYGSPASGAPATSGSVTPSTRGLARRSVVLGAGATWTLTAACTSFTLDLWRSGTDALTVTIDGGTPVAVAAGPSGRFAWTSPALTSGTHTIVVTRTAGTPEIGGVFVYMRDETSGNTIRLWEASAGGSQIADFADDADWLARLGSQVTPDLVVVETPPNDAVDQSAEGFRTDLAGFVSSVRSAVPDVPILIVSLYRRPTSTPTVDPWSAYVAAARDVAATNASIEVIDLDTWWSDVDADPFDVLADTYHPNDRGAALIASAVAKAVMARYLGGSYSSTAQGATSLTVWATAGETPVTIDGMAGENKDVAVRSEGGLRWIVRVGGSGDDLSIIGYTDAGAFANQLTVRRSDGRLLTGGAIRPASYTTANRPAANGIGAGGVIYDSTLAKMVLSNGSAWMNLDGSAL